jgi:hypothetical protein
VALERKNLDLAGPINGVSSRARWARAGPPDSSPLAKDRTCHLKVVLIYQIEFRFNVLSGILVACRGLAKRLFSRFRFRLKFITMKMVLIIVAAPTGTPIHMAIKSDLESPLLDVFP